MKQFSLYQSLEMIEKEIALLLDEKLKGIWNTDKEARLKQLLAIQSCLYDCR